MNPESPSTNLMNMDNGENMEEASWSVSRRSLTGGCGMHRRTAAALLIQLLLSGVTLAAPPPLPTVIFVTPAGDPVGSPVDAGGDPPNTPDGANEFTYNNAATGVLTMKLKAEVPGISSWSDSEKAKLKFELDAIGNSTFAWKLPENEGGKVKVVTGGFIVATATYTELPPNNTDFGLKKARVKYDGDKAGEAEFEVFYPATTKNHPGALLTNDPNWYYYYRQNEGGTDYTYTANFATSRALSGVPNSILIADNEYTGGDYFLTTVINGQLLVTGASGTSKYYRYFYGVVAHERHHANSELTAATSVPPQDSDRDSLEGTYETGTAQTRADNPYSASGNVKDDEAYAGGPVEETANIGADTSQDWANPGSNKSP